VYLHQRSKPPRDRSAPFVLHGMHCGAQRALVGATSPSRCDRARPAAAPGATLRGDGQRSPRRQGLTTPVAQRRRKCGNRCPADLADGPGER
jgi:hypothetical protein